MTDQPANTSTTSGGFNHRLLLIPGILLLLAYLPTIIELVQDWWTDENYSHGFLVPLVSVYLIWTMRKDLAAVSIKPAKAGLGLLILGMLMFIAGTAAAEYFTARLSLVVTLFGLTWYFYGNAMIKRVWFALVFLVFMIPVPYVIYYAVSFPLQLIATKITVGILSFIGMSVVRQGNIIHLSGGMSLEVAEACSGIRSLVSLLALGAIYAYWSQKRLTAQILLFLATIPIAVFANVVRVFFTTLLAATFFPGVTEEPIHSIMGMMVFVVAFVCLFIFGAILRRIFK